MAISVLDTQVGPYSTGWSLPKWSVQQYITSGIATATGGTYASKAPVAEEKAAAKPRVRKTAKRK
jgi:hypothetical protein